MLIKINARLRVFLVKVKSRRLWHGAGLELSAFKSDAESIQVDGAKIEFEVGDDLATTAQKIAAIVFSTTSNRACNSQCHVFVQCNGAYLY